MASTWLRDIQDTLMGPEHILYIEDDLTRVRFKVATLNIPTSQNPKLKVPTPKVPAAQSSYYSIGTLTYRNFKL
jgi:hypothetical protein